MAVEANPFVTPIASGAVPDYDPAYDNAGPSKHRRMDQQAPPPGPNGEYHPASAGYGPTLEQPQAALDPQSAALVIEGLLNNAQNAMVKTDQGELTDKADAQKTLNEQNAKRIADAIKKQQEAQHSGLLGKIFGWIGAIVAVVAAAALTVVTEGAAAPLLAAAVMGVGLMTAQQTGALSKIAEEIGKGIGDLLEGLGVPKDKAQMIGQIAAQVAIAVVALALQLGLIAASGGTDALEEGAQLFATVTQVADGVTQTATAAGSGATSIASGVYSNQADQDKARELAIKAKLQLDEQQIQDLESSIKNIIQAQADGVQQVVQLMEQTADVNMRVATSS